MKMKIATISDCTVCRLQLQKVTKSQQLVSRYCIYFTWNKLPSSIEWPPRWRIQTLTFARGSTRWGGRKRRRNTRWERYEFLHDSSSSIFSICKQWWGWFQKCTSSLPPSPPLNKRKFETWTLATEVTSVGVFVWLFTLNYKFLHRVNFIVKGQNLFQCLQKASF